MTEQLYLKDTYKFYFKAIILEIGEDKYGKFIILNQTIFYPQGGGQPSDNGIIKNNNYEIIINLVRQNDNKIRHYTSMSINSDIVNANIECYINQDRRLLNSKFHTAAHLLSNIIEQNYHKLKAIKGHSFPGEAYVEFQGEDVVDSNKIQNIITEVIARNDLIKILEIDSQTFEKQFYKLPYSIPEHKKFRVMQIGNMSPTPCGGTHLSCLHEIGNINIIKIKAKNNITRISYEVT